MSKRNSPWLLAVITVLAMASAANAWNDTGHGVVALIAYEVLDDAAKKKVHDILKDHPHYEEYLAKGIPPEKREEMRERIVKRAATWSDWVKSPAYKEKYHRGTWHYINLPYIVAKDEDTEEEIRAKFNSPGQNHGDILWVIPYCQKILKAPADNQAKKEKRAIMLCWLFHLVGDLHQPLHAVARCDEQLRGGDRGGNFLYVTRKPGGDPTKLHAVWDSMLGYEEKYDDIKGIARDIAMKIKSTDLVEERKVIEPKDWAEEGKKLAISNVYNFNGKQIGWVVDTDDHAPSKAPELPDGYETEAKGIARKRAALAGYRLADILTKVLADK